MSYDFIHIVGTDKQKAPGPCITPIDVGFILDSSGSLKDDYHKEKAFLNSVAAAFNMGHSQTRAGVVTFSSNVEHSIKLNDHFDAKSFKNAVNNISLMGLQTRIDRALRLAQRQMFTEANGGRAGVPKLLILLTDGSQTEASDTEDPVDVASEIRAVGIKLVVVGIGRGINRTELIDIADGDANVYESNSFEELMQGNLIDDITTNSCEQASAMVEIKDEEGMS